MKQNNFYEPSYLDSNFKKNEKQIFIFYPEILEDFAEFQNILCAEENVTLVCIPKNAQSGRCVFYNDARKEIRMLVLRLRQLHLEKIDLRTVAVNVPCLENIRPYLERELSIYSVSIPRKLKKAARYGIERRVYPKTEEKNTAVGHAYIYTENVEYVILGRRTKWKQKARFKIIKEYKKQLAYMWHRQYDRMITW